MNVMRYLERSLLTLGLPERNQRTGLVAAGVLISLLVLLLLSLLCWGLLRRYVPINRGPADPPLFLKRIPLLSGDHRKQPRLFRPARPSWIHQSKSPKQKIQADAIVRVTKSSERRTGRESVPSAVSLSAEELETPAEQSTSTRSPSGFLPLEPISRAMQSVLRQIRHPDGDPAVSKRSSGKRTDGAASNCDVVPPRGTVTQPKNPVLKRNDFESGQESSRQSQPSARNKKKEPSQAGSQDGPARSSPVLTTSSLPNGDSLSSVMS
ncbi:unnamed protein product [Lota lota]